MTFDTLVTAVCVLCSVAYLAMIGISIWTIVDLWRKLRPRK